MHSTGPDFGVCKPLNGTGSPRGIGLKKNYSPVVLLNVRWMFF